MLIHPCNLADADVLSELCRVQRAAYEVEAAMIGSRQIGGLHEKPQSLSANTSERFIGCWVDDRLAGVIALEAFDPAAWGEPSGNATLISRLAVDPSHFRRGVGRGLVRWALAQNTGWLYVSTGAANAAARRLYESEGFALLIANRGLCPAPDGTPLARMRIRAAGASTRPVG